MDDRDERWMVYIDAEVAAVCRKLDWGHQIRRKWSAREKPVSESCVDDYEWKLLPYTKPETREAQPREIDEGVYFVLGFDSLSVKFVLRHSTERCGSLGPHWETASFTEIQAVAPDLRNAVRAGQLPQSLAKRLQLDKDLIPAVGWLRGHLLDLTAKFAPNKFSIT